jgi:hypothetical protein
MIERDLAKVKVETDNAASNLMIDAYNAMQSDTIKHMVRIQEILDGLGKLDGTLVKYEVRRNKTEWEALAQPAFVQTIKKRFSARVDDKNEEKDGRIRVIGNR